jgi:LPXTG-motif cell wall-anchored protein
MPLRRPLAAALAILALAPAGALAQGAGDDQYSDPFGDEGGGSEQTTPAPTATPAAPPATAAPAPAAPAPAAQTPAAASPSGASPSAAPQLPYTGFEDWWAGAAGTLMLGAGLALRLRLREPD